MVHGCMAYTERAETATVSRGTSSVTTKRRCKCATSVDNQKRSVKRYNHSFRITCYKSMVGDINLPHTDLHHVGDVNPLTYIMSVTSISHTLTYTMSVTSISHTLTYIMSVMSISRTLTYTMSVTSISHTLTYIMSVMSIFHTLTPCR